MRAIAPVATTRCSYSIQTRFSSVCTWTRRPALSCATAFPSTNSACGHIIRIGTTVWRGSIVPEAASGSIGVKSMKFSGLTIVAPRLPSRRAT